MQKREHSIADTQLRAGALKFPAVLMQGITHIAPAVGLVLSIQYIGSLSGVVAPLAYAIAVLIVLALGIRSRSWPVTCPPQAAITHTSAARFIHAQAS